MIELVIITYSFVSLLFFAFALGDQMSFRSIDWWLVAVFTVFWPLIIINIVREMGT